MDTSGHGPLNHQMMAGVTSISIITGDLKREIVSHRDIFEVGTPRHCLLLLVTWTRFERGRI